ncbi:hypothetical protein HYY69_05010 [Candidatus Woesearchaeota archaeon]|nr:hypothetical protein [Candidatus Woesearchaeota archaeon]
MNLELRIGESEITKEFVIHPDHPSNLVPLFQMLYDVIDVRKKDFFAIGNAYPVVVKVGTEILQDDIQIHHTLKALESDIAKIEGNMLSSGSARLSMLGIPDVTFLTYGHEYSFETDDLRGIPGNPVLLPLATMSFRQSLDEVTPVVSLHYGAGLRTEAGTTYDVLHKDVFEPIIRRHRTPYVGFEKVLVDVGPPGEKGCLPAFRVIEYISEEAMKKAMKTNTQPGVIYAERFTDKDLADLDKSADDSFRGFEYLARSRYLIAYHPQTGSTQFVLVEGKGTIYSDIVELDLTHARRTNEALSSLQAIYHGLKARKIHNRTEQCLQPGINFDIFRVKKVLSEDKGGYHHITS